MSSSLLAQFTSSNTYSYGYSGTLLAQTFIMPSGYDRIDYVNVNLKRIGSGGSSDPSISIYNTSSGIPTSSIGSATYPKGSISTDSQWVTFDFSDISVTGGSRYAIVLDGKGTSSSATIAWWNQSSDSYSGGAMFQKLSGGSWSDQGRDATFQVYGYVSVVIPTVTTGSVSSITETSAIVAGNVTSDGGGTIIERGICYSTSSNPDVGDSKVVVSGTTGSFSGTLTGLTGGTRYYAKAYAINSTGVGYGSEVTIDTLTAAPTVTTGSVSNITPTSVSLAGNVTSDHGAIVTERGVVIGASANPTTANTKIIASTGGTGSYTVNKTGLTPNTTYHYRAYAINAVDTSYGTDATFTTADIVVQWCQSVKAAVTGTLTGIDLYLKLADGSVGTPTIKIYSDSAGSPGTLLQTITGTQITNTDYQWIHINTNVATTSASMYWIVLENPYIVGSYLVLWGANSAGGYADGLVKYKKSSSSSYTAYTGYDAAFKIYNQPTLTANYDIDIKYRKRYE